MPMTQEEYEKATKAAAQWGLDPHDFAPLPAGGRSRVWVSLSGLEKLLERETDPEVRQRMEAEIIRRKARFQERLNDMPRPKSQHPLRRLLVWGAVSILIWVSGWLMRGAVDGGDLREAFQAGFKVGAICAHHPELDACTASSLETGGVMP